MPPSCSAHMPPSWNAPWNTARVRGLAGVDLIKDLSHVVLGERDHPVLWVGDGPHTRLDVVVFKA